MEIADDDNYQSESSNSEGSIDQDSAEEALSDNEAGDSPPTPRRPSYSSRDSPKIATEVVSRETNTTNAAEVQGPLEHSPTEAPSLSDGTAFAKHLTDTCFDAPLGQIYELLYGDSGPFMQDFLSKNQKLLDVHINPFSERSGKSTRSVTYVKPLSGPVGPKQTRCLIEEVIEIKDFERCVQILQATTSPDVPSGDAFVIKTRFSLMWGPRNTTRLVMNCVTEWTKGSWIKVPIEKGVTSGQIQYTADLVEALKNHLASNDIDKKKRVKSKKVKDTREDDIYSETKPQTVTINQTSSTSSGFPGILENINTNVLIFVLLVGMMFAMLRMQRSIQELARQSRSATGVPLSARWQADEEDLWTWLADRSSGLVREDAQVERLQSAYKTDPAMTTLQIKEALKQQVAVLKQVEELAAKQARKS